ncbi:MAG: DUF4872 domain-containing protein [Myxococcales bacterium]|nr:DUF4872 domain-containing protein [Myxococcales bacterium]
MATYHVDQHDCEVAQFNHTAALATALRHAGCTAPHSGKPWSEAMLLGLGGGLGAGYILWEFKAHRCAVLTLGFHHRWNDSQCWFNEAIARVGATASWTHASGDRRAARALDATLRNGHPAICWVDEHYLPHLHVSEIFEGCFGWVTTVIGVDAGHVTLDDGWGKPIVLQRPRFDMARSRIASFRHRQLAVRAGAGCGDLAAAVRSAIEAHVAYLGAPSTSFGLGALRQWGRTLADERGSKGWNRQFADRTRLASVFRSMRAGIALRGMDGAGLRSLYAAFLREAGEALGAEPLLRAAEAYDGLSERWRALSQAPFPLEATHPFAEVTPLADMYAAMDRKYAALAAGDLAAVAQADAIVVQLNTELDRHPPWTSDQQNQLFRRLSEHVQALWFAEKQALVVLRRWLNA